AQLHGSNATTSLRVVGQAVFPNFATYSGADNTELGAGALVTTASLAHLGPQFTKSFLLVDLIDGADPAALLPPDDEGLLSLVDSPQLPADVVNFDRVRGTPLALAGLLAALAVASVGHALVTSVRRRRRDLAMFKTLGFVRRQISSLVAWQATTVAVVALAVGLPLGVAAGRWAWSLLANGLGIPPEPVIPVLAVVVTVPAVVGVANLAAALPARRAGHVRPAIALRAE
ncbi:MAG TPA: FtsX-like permease family protein, partial [Acidimicrobiales bacterium]|nr:FtsX-like permease family protein [Acidimicrobiales bacterium]